MMNDPLLEWIKRLIVKWVYVNTSSFKCYITHIPISSIQKAIKEDENLQISIDTIDKYSDIVKDIAESIKDLCKASYYRTLHSSKLV